MMSRIFLFLIFYGLCCPLLAQDVAEKLFKEKNLEIINHCFEGMDTIDYSQIHPMYNGIHVCGLSGLTFLEVSQDSAFTHLIIQQIKLVSRKFFEQGKPIIILRGQGAYDEAYARSKSLGSDSIFYVGFGNSCLSFGDFNLGVTEFNQETRRLIAENKLKNSLSTIHYDSVYTIVDKMPEYIDGGYAGFYKMISKRTSFKGINRDKYSGLNTRFFAEFIISIEGKITNIKVLKSMGAEYDQEIIRVLSSEDIKFTPGIHDGKVVPVRMALPIIYHLK
ncbi:energy transducer TonB [Aureibacter tunicatorum]|uniref:TonB C-terminal domain-containing protein n=1 Tax=Aureibacter tunicatorum TaxID=866807 RepID=A0AAE3XSB4_9BACT|nr:energy transducer TonB [Aureibacter tunicatorum]MDR6240604.1 hypothetical protein [Aureibacter tunicatorum]BDD06535.1 hypothetical protein AUTU_40180 [Aureibacter tunicatorum]